MSQKFIRIVSTLCFMVVAVFALMTLMVHNTIDVSANTTEIQKIINEKEKQLREVKAQEEEIKKRITESNLNAATYEREIAALDSEIIYMQEQDVVMQELMTALETQRQKTADEIELLKKKLATEQTNFDNMLRMSYQYGDDTYISLIFGSENIGDFLSRLDLLDYHFKANENVVDNLTTDLAELKKATELHEKSVESIVKYEQETQLLRSELEKKRSEAATLKASFEKQAREGKLELSQKQSELSSLESTIKEYYAELEKNNNNTSVYTGGEFSLPLPKQWIDRYGSSGYGTRTSPISGKTEFHNGNDYPAPYGTPVYAAADGYVFDSRYSSSWGNVIQIDHGGKITTLYAHLSYRGVSKGDYVKKGQQIGQVGSTGWSTGNHLHFTVYKNAAAVNPNPYLGFN